MQKRQIFRDWAANRTRGIKALAVLIDPDKASEDHLKILCKKANSGEIDYFFVGGSLLTTNKLDLVISYLKIHTEVSVVLFPGNTMQVNLKADAILFLSLISGRNAELLIGKHVEVAPILARSSLEVISTGYMLIDSGRPTSVSYISGSLPIPRDKAEIALSTAMAGSLLGLECNYLEAGSGAKQAVPINTIARISQNINRPLIVGGGIRDLETAADILNAGADIIVVGTKIESDHQFISSLAKIVHHQKYKV